MAVYFVLDTQNNRVKIGCTYSGNPKTRVKQIIRQHKLVDAKVLGIISGSHAVESDIHLKFQHLRIEQEWFSATSELLDWISENTKTPEALAETYRKDLYARNPALNILDAAMNGTRYNPPPGTIRKIIAIAQARKVTYQEAIADIVDEAYSAFFNEQNKE